MQTDQPINSQSGSMQKGIAAPYDFQIMDVIKEAWQRTSGLKGPVLGAGALIFTALIAISFAIILFFDLIPLVDESFLVLITGTLNFIISILSYPFIAGIVMMGLHRAINASVSYKMAFSYFSYTLPIIIASICMSIMIILGFFLLVLPGIYLSIAYMFTLPLIIDKNMDFWQAMETSRKAVTQHWFKFFFTGVLMMIIYLVSTIPLGLGLIWTIPMFVALQGVLYRRIFGVNPVQS
ncbi:hypothetical protein BMR05_08510 [Methylococcaceae bacterium HT4]|nr:hypothetical protein [Methyloprofundus sp.]TXK97149.1 hypothetical protein BMR10_05815 [Methylococcaceae bacterium CS4]TXL01160.1 hypothetical protein BMR11_01050 [Methylococcaceae bacterium CS5]TXL07661.1 hypothetical protein BMR09_04960 [Methylococcaceae bacterium CS3]TXL07742.1 hypothetical protein BMR07_04035 [Methylococcaceae bacterium CS1]TXL10397.1 hypothetical protein BMR08_09440 [Methylococcaceae bacterium CS2]TXL14179.1 hypothetical protein BMR05_08490 [Methylococcaceae bacterium